jgi:hypothetical protein
MDASGLTQDQYKEARARVALVLVGDSPTRPYRYPLEAEELLQAEQLLEAGVIDLEALRGTS